MRFVYAISSVFLGVSCSKSYS